MASGFTGHPATALIAGLPFALSNLVVMLGSEGYIYQYLLGNYSALNEIILIASIYFCVPIGGQLLLYYLEIQNKAFWRVVQLDWVVSTLAVILLLLADQQWIRPAFQVWILLNMLFGTVFVFTMRNKNKMALRILLALLPFWLAVALRSFRNVALIAIQYRDRQYLLSWHGPVYACAELRRQHQNQDITGSA
jgi:hypothetical protein